MGSPRIPVGIKLIPKLMGGFGPLAIKCVLAGWFIGLWMRGLEGWVRFNVPELVCDPCGGCYGLTSAAHTYWRTPGEP